MGKRDNTIDVVKGILIFFLLLYHTIDISKLWLGVSSEYLLLFETLQFLVTSTWMSVFFIITGVCSNFTISISSFFRKTFIGIFLPSLLFSIASAVIKSCLLQSLSPVMGLFSLGNMAAFYGLWFVGALLISKTLYFFLTYLFKNVLYFRLFLLLLTLLGAVLHQCEVPNYSYHQQALLMLPMLYIGQLIRKYNVLQNKRMVCVAGAVYILFMFVLKCFHIHIPRNVALVSLTVEEIPLYCLICTLGFCFFYSLATLFKNVRLLTYVGSRTLAIYCMQFVFIEYTLRWLYKYIGIENFPNTLFVISISILVSGIMGVVFSNLYNLISRRFV